MARLREDIQIVDNVKADQEFTVRLTVGKTWLEAHLDLTNIALSDIENLRVQLVAPHKEVDMWTFKDAAEMDAMNVRMKRHTKANRLSFYFRRPEKDSEDQRMLTALGTGGLDAVRIVGKLKSTVVDPSIKAWGKKTANRHVSSGSIIYIKGTNKGGAVEGENHYDDLNRRDALCALHILNDKIDEVELSIDNSRVHKLTTERNNFDEVAASQNSRTPYATNYGYVIDFTLSNNYREVLVLQHYEEGRLMYQAEEMRVTTKLAASPAAQIRYIPEYFTTWSGLTGSAAA